MLRLRDTAHIKTAVRLLPDNAMTVGFSIEAGSVTLALHEAADILRTLLSEEQGSYVTATLTDVTSEMLVPLWRQLELQSYPVNAQLFMLCIAARAVYVCLASSNDLSGVEMDAFASSVQRVAFNFHR